MSNSTRTVSKSSRKGSKTSSSISPQSLAISEHSLQKDTPTHIRAWLQSLVLASHVNPSLLPADRKPKMIPEICGLPPSMLFAELSQDTASWKMCQDSYRGSTGTLKRFSKTWPRAGIMLNGKLYQQPKWELRTNEIGSSLLPTASAWDGKRGPAKEYNPKSNSQKDRNLNTFARVYPQARMWPTPTQDSAKERTKKYAQGGTCLLYTSDAADE